MSLENNPWRLARRKNMWACDDGQLHASNGALRNGSISSGRSCDIAPADASTGRLSSRRRTACDRCRIKKTKCDGKLPCKRCKENNSICSSSATRKKPKDTALPGAYFEVLESNKRTLISIIYKLYDMVRSSQSWEFGEPELNSRCQPVVHSIGQKLGCLGSQSDIDLSSPSMFPEHESSMAELARKLNSEQPQAQGFAPSLPHTTTAISSYEHQFNKYSDCARSDLSQFSDEQDFYNLFVAPDIEEILWLEPSIYI